MHNISDKKIADSTDTRSVWKQLKDKYGGNNATIQPIHVVFGNIPALKGATTVAPIQPIHVVFGNS